MARDGKVTAGKATAYTATTLKDDTEANLLIDTAVEAAGATVAVYTKAGAAAARTALDTEEATLGDNPALDAAQLKKIALAREIIDAVAGNAATATGKMKQYSEVNATASASVETDMGWVVSAAISVDAGTGYDFADDDTFDAAKTNGVGLDSVSIDFGAGGKLTLDQDAVAHLVDADDDAAADMLYTNTFGTASVSIAADIDDGDSDHLVTAAAFAHGTLVDADYDLLVGSGATESGYKKASAA
ncbi:hypothetical protein N9R76_06295, partial [Planktomarina temperata]|nr:hypothetical protein [Planktomarina temperata]